MTNEKPSKEINPTRQILLSKVAWLHYHEGLTQAEIAERMGISRVTINRLIKEARESGVVEIRVHSDFLDGFKLGQRLCSQYNLRDVIITPVVDQDEALSAVLAEAAAEVLTLRIQSGMTVGFGIGRTVSQIPEHFHPSTATPCRFIGLTGGLDLRLKGVPHTFDTLGRMASATGGEAVYIPAPSYVGFDSVKKALLSEPSVLQALELAGHSDLAVFSIGAADHSALLYQFNQISDQDMADLHQNHAVGDVLGRFFNGQGIELPIPVNQRIIGLCLEELLRIPLKILVAGGRNKRTALKVAVSHQFCDILITDAASADWLLE